MTSAGDLIDLDITGVAHGGVFVGRVGGDGRVVFVPDTLPGERVRVRVTEAGDKSFWRAEPVEILDASPDRVPHVWAEAGLDVPADRRPGGADFGHIALPRQLELKKQVVTDALSRVGRLDLPVTIEAPAPVDGLAPEPADRGGWRTRVSLHVDESGTVGPMASRSHRVVRTETLPLATAAIERAAARLIGERPGRIDLVQPADGRVRVINRPALARGQRRPVNPKDPAFEPVVERVGERAFRVDAGGFWQVHRLAAATLTAAVAAELGVVGVDSEGRHLDLYGGVGLFAATIAELGGEATEVVSVEADERATEHAGENLSEWVGARAETGRVDRWLASLAAGASARDRDRLSRGVVVLDPPRAGAGRDVVRALVALAPAAVTYVACDPAALARDLAFLREAGYETSSVRAIDLFPHSHHIEAVATLTPVAPRG